MKLANNANTVLITTLFTMALLALPAQANAAWMEEGNPGSVLNPNQGQAIHHEVHINITSPVRVEPQNRVQPIEHNAAPLVNHTQALRHDQPAERHVPNAPGYFRRDANYYGYAQVDYPYADVDTGFVVPDGFQAIVVDGQTYYYNNGIFYQEINGQWTAIPPVLGAVVDYIPQDYQIVLAAGVHYLVTGGVYYQRVDQGFEVVQPS